MAVSNFRVSKFAEFFIILRSSKRKLKLILLSHSEGCIFIKILYRTARCSDLYYSSVSVVGMIRFRSLIMLILFSIVFVVKT